MYIVHNLASTFFPCRTNKSYLTYGVRVTTILHYNTIQDGQATCDNESSLDVLQQTSPHLLLTGVLFQQQSSIISFEYCLNYPELYRYINIYTYVYINEGVLLPHDTLIGGV